MISWKGQGKASIQNDEQRRALVEIVDSEQIPGSHGVVRWWLIDLAQWVRDEFGLSINKQPVGREMRALVYHKLSATSSRAAL